MTMQTEIAVLGAGPGGYVAALRAAQLGARVTVIEEHSVGGVCLNVGCIPTKALLRSAEVFRTIQNARNYGLRLTGTVEPDWPAILKRKERLVKRLVSGVIALLRAAEVQVLEGRGRLVDPNTVEVAAPDGLHTVHARHIVLATGSRPAQLPLPGSTLPSVIDSTAALSLEELPARLLIIGGGAIGVEFADIFDAFGVQVTIVEMLDRLLPVMDAELGRAMERNLNRRRVKTHLSSRVTRLDEVEDGLLVTIATENGEHVVEADLVLVAVGRRPNTEDLGLEAAGVRVERTGIPVSKRMETNIPGIYAIGDVTGGMQLAHVASLGGEVAVENALGHGNTLELKTVPGCVYTDPEIASVGLTEEQARLVHTDVRVGRFPLIGSGKALTYGDNSGFVKVISEGRSGELLGLHIMAPHASDLIHEGGLALALDAATDDLARTVHGHPTLGEAIREAALAVRGSAIHLPG